MIQLGLLFIIAARQLYCIYDYSNDNDFTERYFENLSTKERYKKAAELFQKAIEANNDAEAYFQLGELYEHGFGLNQDTEKAAELYTVAAKNNHSGAMYSLGFLCETENGMVSDGTLQTKAYKLYLMAAELGNTSAQFKLEMDYVTIPSAGVVKRSDYSKVVNILNRYTDEKERRECINDLYRYEIVLDIT